MRTIRYTKFEQFVAGVISLIAKIRNYQKESASPMNRGLP